MALIICGDCQKEYSDYAIACPKCGRPTKTQIKEKLNTEKICNQDSSESIQESIENISDESLTEKIRVALEDIGGKFIEKNSCSHDLDKKLENLEKENQLLKNKYVQVAEDFLNYRNRTLRDADDLKRQIISKTFIALIEVLDGFERARKQFNPSCEEALSLHRSYQGLHMQFVEVFKQHKVLPMKVIGEKFDPYLHEAVISEPSDIYKEDIISEELQRGFYINKKILKHALVKVSMGPGKSEE